MTDRIPVKTSRRTEFVEVTSEVAQIVHGSRIESGTCTVFVPHTTAGVTINENADPSVVRDVLSHLDKLVPRDIGFTHAEGNSDSHIKASMMGASVTIPVEGGRLKLGTWQGIYFCEFDGPRARSVVVTVNA